MSDTSSIASASSITSDYMKILVTQLQNQNPLEPMDNNEMAAQLAQLSQLGQIEQMNTTFSSVLSTVQKNYASSLVGKEISFLVENEDDYAELTSGTVEEVVVNNSSNISMKVGDYAVGLSQIL